MRKRLSSGQKWFLRPYFPVIRGMFVFRNGLRFLFRTESEEKAILETGLFLTLGSGTSIAQNRNFLLITFIKDTVLRSIDVESKDKYTKRQ